MINIKVLTFNLYIQQEMDGIDEALVYEIGRVLNCNFKLYDGDKRCDEEVWEAEMLGHEVELAYSYTYKELTLSCESEKICHHMPKNEEREFTDISEQVLNILNLFMPEVSWRK